ncbi:LOW QUALITY PROTEIN: cilia- and flagella-associated protein 45 [Fundulus diaphanus]
MRLASSSKSTGSRSYPARYRMLAPTSQVEETLFDVPRPLNMQSNNQTNQEQETLQIITKDLIRTIRIPRRDVSRPSVVLPPSEFKRIISECQTGVKEQREALKRAHMKEKEEKTKAAEVRKHQLQDVDLSGKQNPVLTDLQLEAQRRAELIVDRANALRMEQEEEVKRLNQAGVDLWISVQMNVSRLTSGISLCAVQLILGAQCQATWDDQIEEKKEIRAQLEEEEKRLDVMMEVERRRALENLEKTDERHKQEMIKGKEQMLQQIQKRMEEKQLRDMAKEIEKEQIHKNQEKMDLEDLKAREKKRKEQQLLQEEIMRINAEVMQAKEMRLEEEKLDDMRAMEYLQKKLEREAEYEAEQKRIKKEKELEIAQLRAQQERARDLKAEQDEVRARRNQEIADRQWRMKQRELAAEKARVEATLKAARLEQVKNKEHCLCLEANREKRVLERVLKTQQEAMAKQKELKEKQLQKALRHAESLRQQMKEQELSALAKRRERFKEVDRLMEEERQRGLRLIEVKEKKLKELKATGISEKYCCEVERKVRKTLAQPNPVKV